MAYLYHYTSADCFNAILREERIRQTPAHSSYAHFGPGVYLTTLDPSVGRGALLRNNRIGTNRLDVMAKFTHFIRFSRWTLPGVQDKSALAGGRSVFLYPNDIDLSRIVYQTGMVHVD